MTQLKDIQNDAKQRVLEVYPRGIEAISSFQGGVAIVDKGREGWPRIGHGDNEAEAWQDAASKLTPTAIGPEHVHKFVANEDTPFPTCECGEEVDSFMFPENKVKI